VIVRTGPSRLCVAADSPGKQKYNGPADCWFARAPAVMARCAGLEQYQQGLRFTRRCRAAGIPPLARAAGQRVGRAPLPRRREGMKKPTRAGRHLRSAVFAPDECGIRRGREDLALGVVAD
jgi:hypothetical protein